MHLAIVEDGWVFVPRLDGLAAHTVGDVQAQAIEATCRAIAVLRRHGLTSADRVSARYLVPHGTAWRNATVTPVHVAIGLFSPGVLVEVELRGRRASRPGIVPSPPV